jgi:hypothetical protein
MRTSRGVIRFVVVSVVLAAGIGGASMLVDGALAQVPASPPAAAQQQPADQPDQVPVQTVEEAIAADAQWYARDQGVTHGEAVRRLRMQRVMGDLGERLRNAHKERLAGIVIEHKPVYRLRVRLTGDLPVAAQSHAMGGSELPVAFETGAKVTLAALRASLAKNHHALKGIFPTYAGVGIDESTSEIVITVVATTAAATAAANAKLPQALELLGVPARIEISPAYPTTLDVRGGSRIVSSTSRLCTTAFVVKHTSGTTGVTTAGHCDNSMTYYNPNGTSIPLTFYAGSEYYDPDQDVQVHTAANYLERPEFYWDDAKTTPRVLSGRRLKSSTFLGDNVCHRGETTGYSCGYVDKTDYAPANATNNLCGGQACLPVFIRVSGGTNECAGGDSGGPFFASTVAFGITGGGTFDSTGRCLSAYYMSTDTISSGWSLLYGP